MVTLHLVYFNDIYFTVTSLQKIGVEKRWFMRSSKFDTSLLSIGADLFVYTEAEAGKMEIDNTWFQSILKDMIWL
jgi:hypothetical protein